MNFHDFRIVEARNYDGQLYFEVINRKHRGRFYLTAVNSITETGAFTKSKPEGRWFDELKCISKKPSGFIDSVLQYASLNNYHFERLIIILFCNKWQYTPDELPSPELAAKTIIHLDLIKRLNLQKVFQNVFNSPVKQLENSTKLNDIPFYDDIEVHLPMFKIRNEPLIKFINTYEMHNSLRLVERYIKTIYDSFDSAMSKRGCSVGPPKSLLRIKQKFDEYSADFLFPGSIVFRRFKDLLRCSIVAEKFNLDVLNGYKIYSKKKKLGQGYNAAYILFEFDGICAELKIVKDEESISGAHKWYELLRCNTIEEVSDVSDSWDSCGDLLNVSKD